VVKELVVEMLVIEELVVAGAVGYDAVPVAGRYATKRRFDGAGAWNCSSLGCVQFGV
jgi:hypothetical protein